MRMRVKVASKPRNLALLKVHLRDIGMGVLGTFFMHSSIKSCSTISPEVSNYLREIGWSVDSSTGFGSRSNHYNLCVLTDAGWIGVDPTYMQFACAYDIPDEADDRVVTHLARLLDYFESIVIDGLNAFQIVRLNSNEFTPGVYEKPPSHAGASWKDHYAKLGKYATRALDGKTRSVPMYARIMRYRRGDTSAI